MEEYLVTAVGSAVIFAGIVRGALVARGPGRRISLSRDR
jgi:hypothetical protein